MMPLPNFIIGGERRSGTTSLYYWMREHPDIYLFPYPDMDYFIEEEITGIREWRDGGVDAAKWEQTHSVEDYANHFKGSEGYSAVGQKDADLLFWAPTHPRLARYLPDCRFIFVLRNPVERAWSQFWNEAGKGREELSFEEAIKVEEDRVQKSAYAHLHLAYIRRGYYAQSLESFFRHIPKDRVLIVTMEQLLLQPKKKLSETYEFLGINPTLGLSAAGKHYNKNSTMLLRDWSQSALIKPIGKTYSRIIEGLMWRIRMDPEKKRRIKVILHSIFKQPASRIPLAEETRIQLTHHYAPHIEQLEQLLQRSFSEWV